MLVHQAVPESDTGRFCVQITKRSGPPRPSKHILTDLFWNGPGMCSDAVLLLDPYDPKKHFSTMPEWSLS